MRQISIGEFLSVISSGIEERRCVQAWIGCACVLFLGFGEEILPPPITNEKGHPEHLMPLYELKTAYSSWQLHYPDGRVLDSDTATTKPERREAERELRAIVGGKVREWSISIPSWRLDIDFANGFRLSVRPYENAWEFDRDVWKLRTPTGFYVCATARSEVYEHFGTEPPKERRIKGNESGPLL